MTGFPAASIRMVVGGASHPRDDPARAGAGSPRATTPSAAISASANPVRSEAGRSAVDMRAAREEMIPPR
jgi:hypothetical protein